MVYRCNRPLSILDLVDGGSQPCRTVQKRAFTSTHLSARCRGKPFKPTSRAMITVLPRNLMIGTPRLFADHSRRSARNLHSEVGREYSNPAHPVAPRIQNSPARRHPAFLRPMPHGQASAEPLFLPQMFIVQTSAFHQRFCRRFTLEFVNNPVVLARHANIWTTTQ
jgi:hypothetical protein